MKNEFNKYLGNTEKELFESDLKVIKDQISKKYPNFDLKKNELLIKHYFILRQAMTDPKKTWTEVSEMERIFDNEHNEIIDDEQIGNILRLMTDLTKKPTEIK